MCSILYSRSFLSRRYVCDWSLSIGFMGTRSYLVSGALWWDSPNLEWFVLCRSVLALSYYSFRGILWFRASFQQQLRVLGPIPKEMKLAQVWHIVRS